MTFFIGGSPGLFPDEKTKLCKDLSSVLQNSEDRFRLWGFSNERYWSQTLKKLSNIKPLPLNQLRVAILTGESNCLSILPELAAHCDIVLFNDLNHTLNLHTQFLISCLRKASNRNEFEFYFKEKNHLGYFHPLVNRFTSVNELWESFNTVDEYFFLSSHERFTLCKLSADALYFSWANADLFSFKDCLILSDIFHRNNAVVSVFNTSNIHHYINNTVKDFKQAVAQLIYPELTIMLYSLGPNTWNTARTLVSKLSTPEQYYCLLNDLKPQIPQLDGMQHLLKKNVGLAKLGNLILKTMALNHGVPLCYVPRFKIIVKRLCIDLSRVAAQPPIRPEVQHAVYLLLRNFLSWNFRQFFYEEEVFTSPKIYIRNNSRNLRPSKMGYFLFLENIPEISYIYPFHRHYHDRIRKLNIQSEKLKSVIRSYSSAAPLSELYDCIQPSDEGYLKIQDLIIEAMGDNQYKLTGLAQKVDTLNLLNSIDTEITDAYYKNLIFKANKIIWKMAVELGLQTDKTPVVTARDKKSRVGLCIPVSDTDSQHVKLKKILKCLYPAISKFCGYFDSHDFGRYFDSWAQKYFEAYPLFLHDIYLFVKKSQQQKWSSGHTFFSQLHSGDFTGVKHSFEDVFTVNNPCPSA